MLLKTESFAGLERCGRMDLGAVTGDNRYP